MGLLMRAIGIPHIGFSTCSGTWVSDSRPPSITVINESGLNVSGGGHFGRLTVVTQGVCNCTARILNAHDITAGILGAYRGDAIFHRSDTRAAIGPGSLFPGSFQYLYRTVIVVISICIPIYGFRSPERKGSLAYLTVTVVFGVRILELSVESLHSASDFTVQGVVVSYGLRIVGDVTCYGVGAAAAPCINGTLDRTGGVHLERLFTPGII